MTGNISIIRAPAAYSGNCGPGTFVTTRSNIRRVKPFAARAPSACSVGGANPLSADERVGVDRARPTAVRGHRVLRSARGADRVRFADRQVDEQTG